MYPTTIKEVFELAIAAEVEAATTYRELADKVERQGVRELLLAIADEEDAHRESLEQAREGDLSLFASALPTVQLSVPLAVPALTPDATPAQILLAAIDAVHLAFTLYSELAAAADDPGLSTLLQALAVEETRHWQKLEQAYDDYVVGGLPV
jgi:rubrerythrin